MSVATILVIGAAEKNSGVLCELLENLKHKVVEAASLKQVKSESLGDIDVVLINHNHGKADVSEIVRSVTSHVDFRQIPVVVATHESSSEQTIEVMKAGAFDHLTGPLDARELSSVIQRALAKPKINTSVAADSENILRGSSNAMRSVEKLIGLAATSNATVLIIGETGTGKDTIARSIHKHSAQANHPLTVIDCTAVPEDYGTFQSLAEGSNGTIILDEIGDLNAQMQAMLVRALKENQPATADNAAARIIATTQFDLINMVKEKQFREDLYYRLNVLPIVVPPLRERGSEILVLAELFLQQASPNLPKSISNNAAKILLDYSWPGNVRELQNLMYHLNVVVRVSVIDAADLSMIKTNSEASNNEKPKDDEGLDYYTALASMEKRLLTRALKESNGSRTEAAKLLGINRQLLYSKLKAHGMEERS